MGTPLGANGPGGEPAPEGFTVTDKRVIDPETGEVRPGAASSAQATRQPGSRQSSEGSQAQEQSAADQVPTLDEAEVAAASGDARVLELTRIYSVSPLSTPTTASGSSATVGWQRR